MTEIEGAGYEDPRPFWKTLIDPFDIHGMITGEGRKGLVLQDGEQQASAAKEPEAQNPATR